MLEVFDRDFKRVAYLENAFNVKEDLKINSVNYLNFDLPADDRKVIHLNPFWYVKSKKGLYRILPKSLESDETDVISVECEHVIATLFDDLMFGNVVYGNLGIYTEDVINFVLDKQKVKRWKLGECDFARQFEYLWEYESLANALFSIPRPISNRYIWTYDTDSYPWTLNLKEIKESERPVTNILSGKNQLKLTKTSEAEQLFTRIYPLGYGEGVNQLTIKDVNNGIPYLQSRKEIIDRYGIIDRVWIDRRYENAQSLKEAAQTMLDEFENPLLEYDVDYINIDEREKIKLGDKIRIVENNGHYDDIVVGIKYDHDEIEKSKITLANKARTVATTIADMADRQRIEMSYSQGATQLYAQSLQVNADSKHGAELNFFIPSEMRIINNVKAKIKLEPFRAYSQATDGGGSVEDTTSSGGGIYETTSSGGEHSSSDSTSAGGGSFPGTATSSGGGVVRDTEASKQYDAGMERVYLRKAPSGAIDYSQWIEIYVVRSHSHGFKVPDHSHGIDVSIPNHKHDFSISIPNHTHSLSVDGHTHSFVIPNHTHQIKPGIYLFGNPSRFEIRVNGKHRAYVYGTNVDVELTEYLLDSKNRISRGSWQNVEIIPNDLAYISIDLMLQGFVQSRGDYTV